jgi:stress response protein YsnF
MVDTTPPAVRYEGDVMIIPVLKEVAVVEKKLMLVEELRVTKTKTEKTETHEIALKKEEVKVERTQSNSPD